MKSTIEKQEAELDCLHYCIAESNKRLVKEDYNGAAVFLENATRSLWELDKLKKEQENLEDGKISITAYVGRIGNPFD